MSPFMLLFFAYTLSLITTVHMAKPNVRSRNSDLLPMQMKHKNHTVTTNIPLKSHGSCISSGKCTACTGNERRDSYCLKTGYKESISCSHAHANGKIVSQVVYRSCAREWSTRAFWLFQACALICFVLSLICMCKRQQRMRSIKELRLAQLID